MIVTIYMLITYNTKSVPSPYQVRTKSDTCSIQVQSKFLQNLPKMRLTFCYFSFHFNKSNLPTIKDVSFGRNDTPFLPSEALVLPNFVS